MIMELGFTALLFQAWRKAGSRGQITEEREKIYLAALEDLTDTDKLRELADEFQKQGCEIQAKMLRKRADLRDLSFVQKKARRDAFERGMNNWTNPDGIEVLAKNFEEATATGAAAALRKHAEDVRRKMAEDAQQAIEEAKKKKVENEKKNGESPAGRLVTEETIQDPQKDDISDKL
jgi:hypothetical protein